MAAESAERALLLHFLAEQRQAILAKVEGLDEEGARHVLVPSGWNLIGLVQHLAYGERWWLPAVMAGEAVDFPWADDNPDGDWQAPADATLTDVVALYQAECEHGDRVIAAFDLDDTPRGTEPTRATSLRWIILHLIEETARHAGHVDIVREEIDGRVGRL